MILIKDIGLIPMTEDHLVLDGVDILIKDGIVKEISKEIKISDNIENIVFIDGRGKIALPGLVNTHTHMGMSLFRNYGNDLALHDWLETAIYPLEAKLTGQDVYYGALLNMVEMIKNGCTRFLDMYMFEEEVAKAALDIGMGATIANGFVDFDDFDLKEARIRENVARFKDSDLIDVAIAPHAIYTVSAKNYERLSLLSEELGTIMHTHLAETEKEVEDCFSAHGKSPVAYLNDIGVFDRPTVAAHCVHLSQEDMEILRDKKVSVAHNPSSNLKLASGFAPIARMQDMGINISLGTDGSASNNSLDMVKEMHLASLLAKGVSGDPKAMNAYQTLKIATVNGARALGLVDRGVVAEGYRADLAIYDVQGAHMTPLNDPVAAMVYSLKGSDCCHVIINGKLVMKDRLIASIDEEALANEVNKRASRLING